MATPSNTIDHVTLSALVEAGAVRGANVVGQPGGWGIVIQYGMTERALAAKRGSIRIFRHFETLVGYLLGVSTRRMDKLVRTLGITGLSKSTVSEMAKDLDEQVAAFRTRPLNEGPYLFVAADALVGIRSAAGRRPATTWPRELVRQGTRPKFLAGW